VGRGQYSGMEWRFFVLKRQNSIQERQSVIAQAATRGLQLSEDGKMWVPINSESRNLPLNQSNVKVVKKLPSDYSLDQSNVTIVTNVPPSNAATSLFVGGSIVALIVTALFGIFFISIPILIFFLFLWGLAVLGGSNASFFEFLFG